MDHRAEHGAQAAQAQPWMAVGRGRVLRARLFWLAAGLLALAAIATGLWLSPAPLGVGTHEQLGLAPCSFTSRTGLPCPGCGATTSFALSVRGQLGDALQAHGAGPSLALLCLVVTVYAPWAIVRRHDPRKILLSRAATILAAILVLSWLVTYALRLYPWIAGAGG